MAIKKPAATGRVAPMAAVSCGASTGVPGGFVDSPASTLIAGLAVLACDAAARTKEA